MGAKRQQYHLEAGQALNGGVIQWATQELIRTTITYNLPHVLLLPFIKSHPSRIPSQTQTPTKTTQHLADSFTAELRFRPVRIYKPTKTTMQSAKGKTKRWLIDWDTLQGAGRWENPLMGWASSADYMQGTQMAFPSKEEAVAFVSAVCCCCFLERLSLRACFRAR